MKRHVLNSLIKTAIGVLVSAGTLFVMQGTVKADALSIYPRTPADATYYCRPASGCGAPVTSSPIYLTVGSGEFDNNISLTKVYSFGQSYTVNIIEATICGSIQNDGYHAQNSIDIVNVAFSMNVAFTGSNVNDIVQLHNIGSACAGRDRSYSITLPASSFNPATGRYEGYIRAEMINPSGATNENSFRYDFGGTAEAGIGYDGSQGFSSLTLSNRNIPVNNVHDLSAEFAPGCSSPQTGSGLIEVFDADRGIYQGTGSYPELVWVAYSRPKSVAGGGGWVPFGLGTLMGGSGDVDSLPFTYDKDFEYRLEVRGLSRPNALAVKVSGVNLEDFPSTYTCTIPNNPPTGSITLSCVYDSSRATGARIDFTVNRSDPEGDPISLVGGYPHNVGGRGFNTWSGSFDGNLGEVGNAIAQITDGKVGHETLVGGSGYTCPPNRPPVYSLAGTAVCSVAGALPVNRELRINFGIVDPDGGVAGVRVSSNGPPYAGYILNANGNFTSPTNYASPARNGVTYTVTFEGRDAQSGAWSTVGTSTYFCYRNPTTYTCTIISSGSYEPGEQLQPIVQVDYNVATGPLSGSVTYSLTNSGGAHAAGSPQTIARNPLGAGAGAPYGAGVFSPIPLPSVGIYTQSATLTLIRAVPDDPGSAVCGGAANVTVAVRPYFKVIGGDIITYNSGAPIYGWNQLAIAPYTIPVPCAAPLENGGQCGAGAQAMVVSAGNNIDGVSSSFRTPGPLAPRTLTMANTSGQWGAGYGDRTPPSFPSVGGLTTVGSIPAGISGGNTVYNMTGNEIFATNLSDGARTTVYHTGTVWIRGNIAYSDSGSFSSIADISRFRLVATGNIYIDPSVTRLDGEYISSGGSIYTCHNSTWTAANIGPALYSSACRTNNLVVNGSLIGSNIKLTRSGGTLVSATPADGVPAGASYTNAGNIAEIIQFTPELFFAKPAGPANIPAGTVYDSITALPPLF